MLVDLPDAAIRLTRLGVALAGRIKTERVGTGMYVTHYNFNHDLVPGTIVEDYPFDPPLLNECESKEAWDEQVHTWYDKIDAGGIRGSYGVCDNPQQLLQKFPEIEADPRTFIVYFSEVRKDQEPSKGGWRWHKWGSYIGDQKPTREYIYDEPLIKRVFTFHIVEVSV